VRYKVEHKKRFSISTSNHILLCLLYKHTDDDVFGDFPKISDHFPKISEVTSKIVCRPHKQFGIFSEKFGR